jgi:trk system potassium uptake protein TrkA
VRVIISGGGETIETVYFLARLFAERGHHVSILNPYEEEAQYLSRRVKATVILGDGSNPQALEQAGARRADVLLSLAPYDPDNLVACQVAQKRYGVPRTLALVNDPDNEAIFRQLGIDEVFSAARLIGSLMEGQTLFDEITHLFPADEGRRHVTEVVLGEGAPSLDQTLQELALPPESVVACILRAGDVLVPQADSRLQVADRLILVTSPARQEEALKVLTGQAV